MTKASPQKPVLPAGSRLSGETCNPTDTPELRTSAQCVGELTCLAATVRPDLAFIAGMFGRYIHAPTIELWNMLKNLGRYLKRTAERQVTFGAQRDGSLLNAEAVGHCDADHGG
jgi:hypothetical protein